MSTKSSYVDLTLSSDDEDDDDDEVQYIANTNYAIEIDDSSDSPRSSVSFRSPSREKSTRLLSSSAAAVAILSSATSLTNKDAANRNTKSPPSTSGSIMKATFMQTAVSLKSPVHTPPTAHSSSQSLNNLATRRLVLPSSTNNLKKANSVINNILVDKNLLQRPKRRRLNADLESDETKALRQLHLTKSGIWDELRDNYGWHLADPKETSQVLCGKLNFLPDKAFVHPDSLQKWNNRKALMEDKMCSASKLMIQDSAVRVEPDKDYISSATCHLDKTFLNWLIDNNHLVYKKNSKSNATHMNNGEIKNWEIIGFNRINTNTIASQKINSSHTSTPVIKSSSKESTSNANSNLSNISNAVSDSIIESSTNHFGMGYNLFSKKMKPKVDRWYNAMFCNSPTSSKSSSSGSGSSDTSSKLDKLFEDVTNVLWSGMTATEQRVFEKAAHSPALLTLSQRSSTAQTHDQSSHSQSHSVLISNVNNLLFSITRLMEDSKKPSTSSSSSSSSATTATDKKNKHNEIILAKAKEVVKVRQQELKAVFGNSVNVNNSDRYNNNNRNTLITVNSSTKSSTASSSSSTLSPTHTDTKTATSNARTPSPTTATTTAAAAINENAKKSQSSSGKSNQSTTNKQVTSASAIEESTTKATTTTAVVKWTRVGKSIRAVKEPVQSVISTDTTTTNDTITTTNDAATTNDTSVAKQRSTTSYFSTHSLPYQSHTNASTTAMSTATTTKTSSSSSPSASVSTELNSSFSRRLSRQKPKDSRLSTLRLFSDGIWDELEAKYGWYKAKHRDPARFFTDEETRRLSTSKALIHPSAVTLWKRRCKEKDKNKKESIMLLPNIDYFCGYSYQEDLMTYLINNDHLVFKNIRKTQSSSNNSNSTVNKAQIWKIVGFEKVSPANASTANDSDSDDSDSDDDGNDDDNVSENSLDYRNLNSIKSELKRMNSDLQVSSHFTQKHLESKHLSELGRRQWSSVKIPFINTKSGAEKAVAVGAVLRWNRKVIPRSDHDFIYSKTSISNTSFDSTDSDKNNSDAEEEAKENGTLSKTKHNQATTISSNTRVVTSSNNSNHMQHKLLAQSAAAVDYNDLTSIKTELKKINPKLKIADHFTQNSLEIVMKKIASTKNKSSSALLPIVNKDGMINYFEIGNILNGSEKHLTKAELAVAVLDNDDSDSQDASSKKDGDEEDERMVNDDNDNVDDVDDDNDDDDDDDDEEEEEVDNNIPSSTAATAVVKSPPAHNNTNSNTTNKNQTTKSVSAVTSSSSAISAVGSHSQQQQQQQPVAVKSAEYLKRLKEADKQVQQWIDEARREVADKDKKEMCYMMLAVWKNIKSYDVEFEEFNWRCLLVGSHTMRALPHGSAYIAPWCEHVPADFNKSRVYIDTLVQDRDYFWLNEDVYTYLLKHGHRRVDATQLQAEQDKKTSLASLTALLTHSTGGASEPTVRASGSSGSSGLSLIMPNTRRTNNVCEWYTSLSLEGFIFPTVDSSSTSTSSTAATAVADKHIHINTKSKSSNSSVVNSNSIETLYAPYFKQKVRLFNASGASYTFRDAVCLCYKPSCSMKVKQRHSSDDCADDDDDGDDEEYDEVFAEAKWGVVYEDQDGFEKLGIQDLFNAIESYKHKEIKPRRMYYATNNNTNNINNNNRNDNSQTATFSTTATTGNATISSSSSSSSAVSIIPLEKLHDLENRLQHMSAETNQLRIKYEEQEAKYKQIIANQEESLQNKKSELQVKTVELKKLQKNESTNKETISDLNKQLRETQRQLSNREIEYEQEREQMKQKYFKDVQEVREKERKQLLKDQISSSAAATAAVAAPKQLPTPLVNTTTTTTTATSTTNNKRKSTSSPSSSSPLPMSPTTSTNNHHNTKNTATSAATNINNSTGSAGASAGANDLQSSSIKLWEAYRHGIWCSAVRSEEEIIKPIDDTLTLHHHNSSSSLVDSSSDYPVGQTIQIFNKRSTTDKNNPLIRVSFQREVVSDVNSKRQRTRRVANEAIDAGGLVTEWLDDYMEKMQLYEVNVSDLAPARVKSCEAMHIDDGANPMFPLFTCLGNAKHFLPSRLCVITGPLLTPVPLTQDPTTTSSSSIFSNLTKPALAQQKNLYAAYETFGKVLNQMMRQHIPIPEAFASVLLIAFLVEDSMEDIKHRSEITIDDWLEFLKSVDYDTFGLDSSPIAQEIHSILSSSSSSGSKHHHNHNNTIASTSKSIKDRLFDEIVVNYVIRPRLCALNAIKRGFDLVKINRYIKTIPLNEFIDYFFSKTYVQPDDIVSILTYHDPDKNLTATQLQMFQKCVEDAIMKMSFDECNSFLKFTTGSGSFYSQIHIKITPTVVPLVTPVSSLISTHSSSSSSSSSASHQHHHSVNESLPLAMCTIKSYTCFNGLYIPYPFNTMTTTSNAASAGNICDWYNSDFIFRLLQTSITNGLQSDFSDK